MPLPVVPIAATIRVYRIKAGSRPSAPQGGRHHGLAQIADLRHEAITMWNEEIKRLTASTLAPAAVVPSRLGPDVYVVTVAHPEAGMLRMTVISVEPA
jgi:hypothetical protein